MNTDAETLRIMTHIYELRQQDASHYRVLCHCTSIIYWYTTRYDGVYLSEQSAATMI